MAKRAPRSQAGRRSLRVWELFLAVAATLVPILILRAYQARAKDRADLALAFLMLGTASTAFGITYRRRLGWLGIAGCILVAGGAVLAASTSGQRPPGDPTELSDAAWRAHFVAMTGSLVVVLSAARVGVLTGRLLVGALVTSWAHLGAWGVGVAWMSWALLARSHNRSAQAKGPEKTPGG